MKHLGLRVKNGIGIYPDNLGDMVKLCKKTGIQEINVDIKPENFFLPFPLEQDSSEFKNMNYSVDYFERIDIFAYYNTIYPYIRGKEFLITVRESSSEVKKILMEQGINLEKRLIETGLTYTIKTQV